MEHHILSDAIEREAVGFEFIHSMEVRNHANNRRGAIRINKNDILRTMETGHLKGLDISPPEVDEIVTDSESEDD